MQTDPHSPEHREVRFGFGENWRRYARHITPERMEQARAGLLALLEPGDIRGRTFLDIGCGSGIHALAALQMGARHVTAVDLDPEAVTTAEQLIRAHWAGDNVTVQPGNVLDGLPGIGGPFDVVYSWGVLHHTGAMWEAIHQAARHVAPGGLLVLAIYHRTPFCGFWKREKRFFASAPAAIKVTLAGLYALLGIGWHLARGRNPVRHIREYNRHRGMSWWHDRLDWLGGYPYESATPVEVSAYVAQRGCETVRVHRAQPPLGIKGSHCAEYVFRKRESNPVGSA